MRASFAIFLLAPGVLHAQPQSSPVHVRTFAYPQTGRGPGTGFSIGMNPGPGNAYNYAYVTSVVSGSAADKAGLMVGDTIVAVDGRDVLEGDYFPVKVAGTRYVMRVRRGSDEVELVFIYPHVEQAPPRDSSAASSPP